MIELVAASPGAGLTSERRQSMVKILSLLRVVNFFVVVASIGSSALAAGDRTAPSRPTNLRVTSSSAYQISLAWNASTDNSGALSYKVFVSYGSTYTVP